MSEGHSSYKSTTSFSNPDRSSAIILPPTIHTSESIMEGESSVAKSQPDSLFFTKLPRELRDLIYSLAYIDADSEDRDYRIIGIPEWIKKERQKRRFAWAQVR